jgi:hypothetical protein
VGRKEKAPQWAPFLLPSCPVKYIIAKGTVMTEYFGQALLQPADSARVADALVAWIEGEDVSGAVSAKLHDLFWPVGGNLNKTWLADVIEDACNRMVREVAAAVRERA